MMRYEAIMHNTGAQTERLCQPRYIRGFVLVAIFECVLRYESIEYFREKSILLKKKNYIDVSIIYFHAKSFAISINKNNYRCTSEFLLSDSFFFFYLLFHLSFIRCIANDFWRGNFFINQTTRVVRISRIIFEIACLVGSKLSRSLNSHDLSSIDVVQLYSGTEQFVRHFQSVLHALFYLFFLFFYIDSNRKYLKHAQNQFRRENRK